MSSTKPSPSEIGVVFTHRGIGTADCLVRKGRTSERTTSTATPASFECSIATAFRIRVST